MTRIIFFYMALMCLSFTFAQDQDGDGVLDDKDNCANTPAGESVNSSGCSASQTDSDVDGVADADDLCPNTTIGARVDADGCEIQDGADDDNDGVIDTDDQCLGTPSGESVNDNGCSQSQLDDDNDNVYNSEDACPNTEENAFVDTEGCSPFQVDYDKDGVLDYQEDEQCFDTPEGESVNSDGCSLSQLDSDEDGITDDVDACPNSEPNADVGEDGCEEGTGTGLNELRANGVHVYPIPANDFIMVRQFVYTYSSLLITTSHGVFVADKALDFGEEYVDLSHLEKGIYILTFKGSSTTTQLSVVVE